MVLPREEHNAPTQTHHSRIYLGSFEFFGSNVDILRFAILKLGDDEIKKKSAMCPELPHFFPFLFFIRTIYTPYTYLGF